MLVRFRVNKSLTRINPKLVMTRYQRAEKKVLNRIGAFVRSDTRKSFGRAKSPSKPGQPPRVRTAVLKRGVLFGYDQRLGSVVIGPIKVGGRIGGADQPINLEEGGTIRIPKVPARRGQKKRAARRVPLAPRPYMGPALLKNLPKLPGLWRDAVR